MIFLFFLSLHAFRLLLMLTLSLVFVMYIVASLPKSFVTPTSSSFHGSRSDGEMQGFYYFYLFCRRPLLKLENKQKPILK